LFIQGEISHQALEPVIFLLQLFETFSLVDLQAAVLSSPMVIGVGFDLGFPAGFFD